MEKALPHQPKSLRVEVFEATTIDWKCDKKSIFTSSVAFYFVMVIFKLSTEMFFCCLLAVDTNTCYFDDKNWKKLIQELSFI